MNPEPDFDLPTILIGGLAHAVFAIAILSLAIVVVHSGLLPLVLSAILSVVGETVEHFTP
jgi:hypothetical protein